MSGVDAIRVLHRCFYSAQTKEHRPLEQVEEGLGNSVHAVAAVVQPHRKLALTCTGTDWEMK